MIIGHYLVVDTDVDKFNYNLGTNLKSIQEEGLKADVKYSACFNGEVVHSALILVKGCDFNERD